MLNQILLHITYQLGRTFYSQICERRGYTAVKPHVIKFNVCPGAMCCLGVQGERSPPFANVWHRLLFWGE